MGVIKMEPDKVQKLREELAILRTYQAVAEHNLKQLGLNLKAAQKQGWVSKRAETRRKRGEKKKAAEDAKWAEIEKNRQWIREERKKVGLPVEDPTPSPSEAAYRERAHNAAIEAKERSLRSRVRRVSHQLLIAAALGKQYREVTTADQSGHNVPGADTAVRLEHVPLDARSESGLSATEAMARSFRNWANREKQYRAHSRSQTPSTIYASSRTTGPETTISGSASDSSFTDDDADVVAAMALVYDTYFWDGDSAVGRDDDSDNEDDDKYDDDDDGDDYYSGGIAGLSFNDISDDIKLTVCGMLAAAGNDEDGVRDWADILATTVSNVLYELPPTPSQTPASSDKVDFDTDDDDSSSHLSSQAKEILKFFQVSPPNKTTNVKTIKPSTGTNWPPSTPQKKGKGKRKGKRASPQFLKEQEKQLLKDVLTKNIGLPSPQSLGDPSPEPPTKKLMPKKPSPLSQIVPEESSAPPPETQPTRQDRERQPLGYKPPPPDQSVWDPSWWRVNKTDYDDGVWAGKDPRFVQPKPQMETGWITWEEQERRFPRLDERLKLHRVGKPNPAVYDPSTVDTQVWDPLNRVIAEARTGKREPLRLNPVTIHSLARWAESGYGVRYSLDPVRQPDKPSAEDKKRPLPSVLSFIDNKIAAAKKQKTTTTTAVKRGGGLFRTYMGQGKRKTNKVALAPSSVSVPGPSANQAVASIHYPLKSPGAQSFSKVGGPGTPGSEQQFADGYATSAIAGLKSARSWTTAQTPLTPSYPRSTGAPPSTPTVSLYESPKDDNEEDTAEDGGGAISVEERQKLAAFLDKIRSKVAEGKRAATEEPLGSALKKRRTGEDGNEDEDENDDNNEEEEEEEEEETVYPATPASLKTPKSVRFDVQGSESGSSGPSSGMRDGARRAIGRYERTSSRRGPLPVR